jgi:hypothetical protein
VAQQTTRITSGQHQLAVTGLIFCLLTLSDAALRAQLTAPGPSGVVMGHLHLATKDMEASKRFWTALGAVPVQNGQLQLIQLPGTFVMLRQSQQTTAGSEGSTVERVMFRVRTSELLQLIQRLEQATGSKLSNLLTSPEGVTIELRGAKDSQERHRALVAGLLVAAISGPSLHAQHLPAAARADRIIVEKAARTLSLYHGDRRLKTYKIALGRNPSGHKQREGDGRTPEGIYTIDSRKPDSAFHRALHISYPNAEDRRRARQQGVSPGGAIMIHGLPNGMGALGKSHLLRDWTDGCIAVSNDEIEEIWRAVPNGTRIEIKP